MSYQKIYKKTIGYFVKHPEFNAITHAVGGVGIGIILASPVAHPHPVRWGVALITLSIAGHIYASFAKK